MGLEYMYNTNKKSQVLLMQYFKNVLKQNNVNLHFKSIKVILKLTRETLSLLEVSNLRSVTVVEVRNVFVSRATRVVITRRDTIDMTDPRFVLSSNSTGILRYMSRFAKATITYFCSFLINNLEFSLQMIE